MDRRKRAPISTQTGGARILPHARYPSRPLILRAHSSACRDRWPRQSLRSLVIDQHCPQESPPISSQYGQRRSLREQNRILDVPTKVSSLLHHEPGPHKIVTMNCREITRKGHEPSILPRVSRCRRTRRAARSLCDGRGSKSRGGHHRNRMRRQLRDHRARFVSS